MNNLRLGDLNNRNLFSYSHEGQKCKIKVSADVVTPEGSPWVADGHPFAASSHSHPSVYALPWYVQISSSFKDTNQIGLGPTLTFLF